MKNILLCLFFLMTGMTLAAISSLSSEERETLARVAAVRPAPRQVAWQRYEMTAFFHYGINTYTGREWGDGKEDPALFNPTALDCRQWVRAVKAAGVKLAILTAKHHDGFCLWPSRLTKHSVAASPWRKGRGDVCREFVNACRAEGIKVGMYLSPWDRHESTYGTPAYNDFFVGQLNELFDAYGPIDEIWFDGACGEGPNGKQQIYDWNRFYATIRARNANCVIAVSGPDVRWVGNESGLARESEWSVVPAKTLDNDAVRDDFKDYHFDQVDITQMAAKQAVVKPQIDATSKTLGALQEVLAADHWVWFPAECDVSIRPGWFYHPEQNKQVKSVAELMRIYDRSVGRNAVLLLNIPPMPSGRLHDTDVSRLKAFGEVIRRTFSNNLLGRIRPGQTMFKFLVPTAFDTVMVQEDITQGQLVERFHVEILEPKSNQWKTIASATTIGYKRILRLTEKVTARAVRLVVDETRADPKILRVGVYNAAPVP